MPYARFLEECVQAYNAEARERKGRIEVKEPKMPDISPDAFAMALGTLIYGRKGEGAVKTRILGTWRREPDEGDFYYTFREDGSFETNEFDGEGILTGNYTVGPDNTVLMEPVEPLKFTSLLFSQNADSLIITLKDGLAFEYKKGC